MNAIVSGGNEPWFLSKQRVARLIAGGKNCNKM
jgi:hypothetical protein